MKPDWEAAVEAAAKGKGPDAVQVVALSGIGFELARIADALEKLADNDRVLSVDADVRVRPNE